MPVKLYGSDDCCGLYEDNAVAICQYCNEEIGTYTEWCGQVMSSTVYDLECKLYHHERHCINNPDNERRCEECDHFYCWAGDDDDCMIKDEHFTLRDAKHCENWED